VFVVEAAQAAGQALRQAPHDRFRESDCALEPGGAHELDGLVDGRVRRHGVHEGELIRAGAERCANWRVELPYRRRPSISMPWSSVRTR
jgi:hypothetical protein